MYKNKEELISALEKSLKSKNTRQFGKHSYHLLGEFHGSTSVEVLENAIRNHGYFVISSETGQRKNAQYRIWVRK